MHRTSFAPTRLAAAAIITLAAAGAAQAANITWATGPAFNGPNGHLGILTNGTLVQAVNLNGAGGTDFTVGSGVNITFDSVNSPFFTTNFGSATGGGNTDAGWAAILSTFEWQSGANVTAPSFLSGLTTGNVYQVQLFTSRNDGCCGRTHWYGDGNGNISTAKGDQSYLSVVGTFTADTATQTIEFFDSSLNPYLNAYVLRDLTPAIPEPGTYAMMLAGLGLLGFTVRRRKQEAA